MGCDGGTIPRRDELVRLKKKPEQKDKDSERRFRWRHCAITQQKLQQPIVMCGLGRLYSKQSVIEALLNKSMPESCAHIKSLKDVKNLKLAANPAYSQDDDKNAPFICALIGLEMSGQFRFVALWTCGCVVSERALNELKTNTCSICLAPYTEQDIIILNGSDEDVDLMAAKMESRTARLKAEKKDKKNKSKAEETIIKEEPGTPSTSSDIKPNKITFTFKSAVTASKRELLLDPLASDPNSKKVKKDYSIADDNNATEVFKSLFTSHDSDKKQDRAHWITYNPHYN